MKRFFAGLALMCGLAASAIGQAATDPFPPIDQKFFTATTPSVDTVNAFLKAQWGFDPARVWKVMAVQSTAAAGISKVTVFVTDNTPNAKVQSFSFFTTPDGNHAIVDGAGIIPFGAKPFEATRKMMEERVNGAAHGAASKDLLLVEFADMQCPHCKTAQDTMKQIAADFPQARIVYQSYPLVNIHPSAFQAAAYGVCVQKAKNDAFFVFAQDVFDHQEALTAEGTTGVLSNAVTKAGLDPAAIAACSTTAATKAAVDSSVKLAEDAQVEQTPTLVVNGRLITITEVPYESLKKMIEFQAAAK
ncbi:Thioredoxin [Granulicella pectinivorans]|uniref:Thioredoxin n=1 Tax=Granulicella pectinivorans TaxID=474950 RepID=A0A1I6MCY4_9BACT|nr:thioredoxin domain-containing protein [Granulicella pectinivorans]SFS13457.1 Thioredoxin [Granulicella pectinivorans]